MLSTGLAARYLHKHITRREKAQCFEKLATPFARLISRFVPLLEMALDTGSGLARL